MEPSTDPSPLRGARTFPLYLIPRLGPVGCSITILLMVSRNQAIVPDQGDDARRNLGTLIILKKAARRRKPRMGLARRAGNIAD